METGAFKLNGWMEKLNVPPDDRTCMVCGGRGMTEAEMGFNAATGGAFGGNY